MMNEIQKNPFKRDDFIKNIFENIWNEKIMVSIDDITESLFKSILESCAEQRNSLLNSEDCVTDLGEFCENLESAKKFLTSVTEFSGMNMSEFEKVYTRESMKYLEIAVKNESWQGNYLELAVLLAAVETSFADALFHSQACERVIQGCYNVLLRESGSMKKLLKIFEKSVLDRDFESLETTNTLGDVYGLFRDAHEIQKLAAFFSTIVDREIQKLLLSEQRNAEKLLNLIMKLNNDFKTISRFIPAPEFEDKSKKIHLQIFEKAVTNAVQKSLDASSYFLQPAIIFFADMLFVNKSVSKGRFKMVLNVLDCLSPGGKVQFASLYRSSVCKRLMNGLSDLEAEKMFLDGWNGVMIDEACRRSLKMIQEVSVKSPVLSGSIWPTPYRQNTQVVTEITDAKIKQKIQEEQSKIEKSLKTDQVVYCWQEASQVVLKKPNVVVSIPQFEVLKKVLKNDKLSERELVISAQFRVSDWGVTPRFCHAKDVTTF